MSYERCVVDGCTETRRTGEWCAKHAERADRFGHPTRIVKKPATLPDHLDPIWDEMVDQVDQSIGLAGLEALCVQVYRLREAQRKVSAEGLVVADAKGNPTAHPALRTEKDAQSEIRRWIKDFGVR